MIDVKDIMSVRELSKYLGVSETRIYALKKRGELPYYHRSGLGVFFVKSEIDEWLNDGSVVSVAKAIREYKSRHRIIQNFDKENCGDY